MKPNPAKKNRTRQATAAVLALALGAAVYLNWSFARAAPQDLTVGARLPTVTRRRSPAVIDPLTGMTRCRNRRGCGHHRCPGPTSAKTTGRPRWSA